MFPRVNRIVVHLNYRKVKLREPKVKLREPTGNSAASKFKTIDKWADLKVKSGTETQNQELLMEL